MLSHLSVFAEEINNDSDLFSEEEFCTNECDNATSNEDIVRINSIQSISSVDNTASLMSTSSASSASSSKISGTVNDQIIQIDAAANNIIKNINPSWSDFQKIYYVHDWFINNITYDLNAPNRGTIYGALIQKRAICSGYAIAFRYLMRKLNIDCKIVVSNTADHAWNIVKLEGNWYYDDPTNDILLVSRDYLYCPSDPDGALHTTDWTADGINVYNDLSIGANNYTYFQCISDSDITLSSYTDNSFTASDYNLNKDLYDPYSFSESGNNFDIIGSLNATGTGLYGGMEIYPEGRRDYYNDLIKYISSSNAGITNPTERSIYAITGYENGILHFVSILNNPAFSTTDRYTNPYAPIEHTLDISDYVKPHTVTFNLNGGDSTSIPSQSILYGNYATEPANPTKSISNGCKYTFKGWYKEAACNNRFYFSNAITANTTLYAGWNTLTSWAIRITFQTNGGTPINPTSVFNDTTYRWAIYGENTTKENCTFEYWCTDPELNNPLDLDSQLGENDITLYAKWRTNSSGNENGNGGNNPPSNPSNPTNPTNPENPEDKENAETPSMDIADPFSEPHKTNASTGTETVSSGNAKYAFDSEKSTTVIANTKVDITHKFDDIQKAKGYNSSAKFRYLLSNKKIASINKKGILTAKKRGVIDIYYQQKPKGGDWTTIGEPVHMYIQMPVMVKKKTVDAIPNQKIDAYSFLSHTTYSPTKWESSKSSVASIDDKGVICHKLCISTRILDIKFPIWI